MLGAGLQLVIFGGVADLVDAEGLRAAAKVSRRRQSVKGEARRTIDGTSVAALRLMAWRTVRERFARLACWAAHVSGTFWAFAVALGIVFVWTLTGPFFHFSDTWQL